MTSDAPQQLPEASEARVVAEEIVTELPAEISAEETLLRSLRKTDVNRQKMAVKPASLKPGSKGRDAVSLIRALIGANQAKNAAIEHVHHDEFWTFGSARKDELSPHCEKVYDDPAPFVGHANMVLGYDIPAGPPHTPPGMDEVYEEAVRRLVKLAAQFTVASPEAA